jgi:pSer/pThr/pTyr-binding forkhead associated (FHA) protein
MKTRLVNYRDGEIHLSFAIDRPKVTIGRAVDNMIQLAHENISKHHGLICKTEKGWSIEDLKSRNGVFVNGTRIEKADLKEGDRVKIGPHEFYFETNVPSDDFVPSHIIEMSTIIGHQTVIGENTDEKGGANSAP